MRLLLNRVIQAGTWIASTKPACLWMASIGMVPQERVWKCTSWTVACAYLTMSIVGELVVVTMASTMLLAKAVKIPEGMGHM